MKLYFAAAAVAALAFAAAGAASANVTFSDPTTGTYSVGIGPDGELYDNTTGVGLRNPAGADYIAPGDPRDSWGITSSVGSAFADYEDFGTGGITTPTVTTVGANTATTVSTTAAGITVSQTFTFFSQNIVSVQETLTNTSGADLTGVIFRRDVDYDVSPTEFNENTVGPFGSDSQVLDASFFGFENPNPASGPFVDQCSLTLGCNETADLGAGVDIGVGNLGAGDSTTFAYFYGVNEPGQTLLGLIDEAKTEGLAFTLGTQSSENGPFPNLGSGAAIFGVTELGVVAHSPTPEPATWAMMLIGFGGMGAAMRSRRKAQAATA